MVDIVLQKAEFFPAFMFCRSADSLSVNLTLKGVSRSEFLDNL